jgi:inorganic pyrophosphatase
MNGYKNLDAGKNAPKEVNVIIEIPLESNVKYELNLETGIISVDRILYTAMSCPFNYGFVPGTLEEDGDPIDMVVYSFDELAPGCIIKVRPIGMLETEDEKGKDFKIIGVPIEKVDPRFDEIKDINDLPHAVREKIEHYFMHYKELEKGKWVKILGWRRKEEALKRIKKAMKAAKSKKTWGRR